jgi:outer membrane receptor protein involved in Fe transport
LILNEFSFGAHYRLRHADLEDIFTDVSPTLPAFNGFITSQHPRATLHQLYLFTIFNHPSGFFSQFQSVWNAQSNSGYSAPLPGDDFWQFNAFVGYRLPRRHLEVSVGVLNLTDRDYRLNPLTLYAELPRERTAVMTLKLNF